MILLHEGVDEEKNQCIMSGSLGRNVLCGAGPRGGLGEEFFDSVRR